MRLTEYSIRSPAILLHSLASLLDYFLRVGPIGPLALLVGLLRVNN